MFIYLFKVQICAVLTLIFSEASRMKGFQTFLRLGRDSGWPLRIMVASTLDKETTLSVTYVTDLEACAGTVAWTRAKFSKAATAGQTALPPAFHRQEVE
jgi:hypothetical protein